MKSKIPKFVPALLVLAIGLTGCASTMQNLVKSPDVKLSNVQVVGLGLKSQTFLLSFDVHNPNAFALPVRSVSYGVKLDGQRFATGKTPSEFSIPASGETQFAISVDLNLLQTAPQLLSIVRQSAVRDVSYELEGTLAVDIPLAPAVSFRNDGLFRLSAGSL